ncbi:MAG: MiaB/RimO family radical SAM methylthiotransferase [Patescibacteria group bacterium]
MKYFILTYGCQMNKSDSERIAADLERKKYKPALDIIEADFLVVNMCSVRQSAVDRIYGVVKNFQELKDKNPKLKIALAGCVLKQDLKKLKDKFDLFIDNKKYSDTSPCRNDKRALIPISYGCKNSCTYCVVPQTRGSLSCRPSEEIIREAKRAVKNGYKEICLLGQNVNDYKAGNINFAKLLKKVSDITGDFSIHFLSSNPKDFSDKLINTIAGNKKISKYLYIPVQSGDDKILKLMNRTYTAREYKKLIEKIRKKIPDVNLATDFIVGFPGETRLQFENTRKFAKDLKFDIAFVNKYSPRPETAVSKMKDNISSMEKIRRWKILNKLINEKTKNK